MNSTRATIALEYVRRAVVDLEKDERALRHYLSLAREYGCSQAEIAEAARAVSSEEAGRYASVA